MPSSNKFASIKRATEALLAQVQQCIVRGDYQNAEKLAGQALQNWRAAAAPKDEEGNLVTTLGKCLEAQRKYEEAYDLYMQSLNSLTGPAYAEVYSNFLYLNERLGTFGDKSKSGQTPPDVSKNDNDGPSYPQGYYDDFG